MRVLHLPRRRYSVPETVMRKYRLRHQTESSSESSSGGGGGGGGRGQGQGEGVDRWSQTSPDGESVLGRIGSAPYLATPSPCGWSDCQTVSERTTSTQDSTLSLPSTTPENTQVALPETVDRKTSVTGLEPADSEEASHHNVGVQASQGISTACQTGNNNLFRMPNLNVFKVSSESMNSEDIISTKQFEEDARVNINERDPISFLIKTSKPEIACARGNYNEHPVERPSIPRFSAIPRSNSMLVNASSVEYSSDSDLSLTDSLEDPDEFRCSARNRHDDRPVRGEVRLQQERRILPRGRDAYAYFLSLTGEEDMIREYSAPEWLRLRLRKREDEIKKAYEEKLNRHQQCSFHRRRKKMLKKVRQKDSSSSNDRTKKSEITKPDNKTVRFNENFATSSKNNVNTNTNTNGELSNKCSIRLVNGNNMGVEPKIDNILRNNNYSNNKNTENDTSQHLFVQNDVNGNEKRVGVNSNLLQISEVIKIEMSDSMKTIITKEKQINIAPETQLKDKLITGRETIKNELSNTTKSSINKKGENDCSAEVIDSNMVQMLRQVEKSKENGIPPRKPQDKKQESSSVPKDSLKVPEIVIDDMSCKKEEGASSRHKEANPNDMRKEGTSSKIEIEKRIADILISAIEENTRAHQTNRVSEGDQRTDEKTKMFMYQGCQKSIEKVIIQQEILPSKKNTSVQTEDVECKKGDEEVCKKFDKSCNTEAYLVSIAIQTSDQDSEEEEEPDEMFSNECQCVDEEDGKNNEDIDNTEEESQNLRMLDKACNTIESESISTQTNESILMSGDIVNGIKTKIQSKKKEITFPPQVIKQIITGTGEYKTVDSQNSKKDSKKYSGSRSGKVSKGTNTEDTTETTENNKNIINNVDTASNRKSTPFCKNTFSTKSSYRKSEVLELNVPPCSCHMCTLQKISPRGEINMSRSKIPQSRKIQEAREEKKSTQKPGGRRNNVLLTNKFRMFEAIPEERNSSTDSNIEERKLQKKNESDSKGESKEEKGVLTEPQLVDQIIQVGSNIVNVATNTEPETSRVATIPPRKYAESTQTYTHTTSRACEASQTCESGSKSSLVIGRYRPETRESPILIRQYKGRASLSTAHVEGQEQLLTLSKGWINFYLLKDNLDFSDSNAEDGQIGQTQITSRRRVTTIEKEEDKIEQFTVEIHASPEPTGKGLLPDVKKKSGAGIVSLPELPSSSASSTPDKEMHQVGRRGETVRRQQSSSSRVTRLPGMRKSKKTRRSQINLTREDVTERHSHPGSGHPGGAAQPHTSTTTRAVEVEVARSEQSISSITSSTVILSESPPPQPHRLPERRSHSRPTRALRRSSPDHRQTNGSSWTVTVAGSSGSGNDPPPDVEMKLTFGKLPRRQGDQTSLHQYQDARSKRQDRMIEEYGQTIKDEKQSLQYASDLSFQSHQHPKSWQERARGGTARDNFSYEEDYINRLSSRRSKYSTEDGSETSDLHVTGLAITPERKPRVPTQSERDILRPQRYKFTR